MATVINFEKGEDLFWFVHDHLMTQGEKSVDQDGDCRYRGDKGMMCAIGCLIPDDVYRKSVEGSGTNSLRFKRMVKFDIGDMSPVDTITLLEDLQEVHDEYDPDYWEEYLASTYKNFWGAS